tara:strand:- start:7213 stop:7647 length:435 start_codon:yes stop_codon:yes gene_type:complete
MKTLEFTIIIKASLQKVWHCMWEPESYKLWISPFGEGSHYKTTHFVKGAKIHFLTPQGEGVHCKLAEVDEPHLVVLEYLSAIKDFKETPFAADHNWTGARESYALHNTELGTRVTAKVDTDPIHIDFMNSTFPKALYLLKQLAE